MEVMVRVPASLRQFAAGAPRVGVSLETSCATLESVLASLRERYPGVVERALDESGRVRDHVNIFIDGDSIRAGAAQGLATPVRPGAEIWILPAVSGG